MACRPYNTGRCLLLRLFNPSKLWGSLQNQTPKLVKGGAIMGFLYGFVLLLSIA